jgi:general secretion pathway protein A
MIRGRSRKLFSRILWVNPEVELDPTIAAPAPAETRTPAVTPHRTTRARPGDEPSGLAQPDLYNDHFGFSARPFALTPDPDFLFWPPGHLRAYTMLEYGVMTHAPITLITGDVGAGKTTLLLHLLRQLGRDVRVGLISNPNGSRNELLRWVLHSLEQPAELDESYVDLFSRFQNLLFSEYAAGRRVILVFDEAQNLSTEALEELRMFININSGKDELLQLVLIGQPELREMVSRREMRQFAQRIAASYHLTAMDLKTIRAYIPHRLKAVGCERRIFSPSAVRLIFDQTKGVPRLVNQLCDLSLVYAFSKAKMTVSLATVQQVLDDGAFFAVHADIDEAVITE